MFDVNISFENSQPTFHDFELTIGHRYTIAIGIVMLATSIFALVKL